MKKVFSLFMIALMLCTGIVSAEPLPDDEELFPVAKYIDNWGFTDAETDAPKNSWQQLPIFEDGMAVFDTSRNSRHPCFDATSFKSYAQEKYIVMDFTIKGVKKLYTPFRFFDSGMLSYNGETISVPGYGAVALAQNDWHRVTYVMDMEGTTVAGNKVSGIKPHALYIDGVQQTMTKPNETASAENIRVWIEIKNPGNNTSDTADIIYMNHYRVYVMDRITVAESSVKTGDVISQKTDKIELEFSHAVDPLSAETWITLKKDNGEGVSVTALTEDKKVTLTLGEELEYGRNYIITMTDLLSADGKLKYDAEDISFYTENQPLYEFGEITADGKISITSNWIENRTAVFVACVYDSEGKLISADSDSAELTYQVSQEITLAESVPTSGKIKVFVFDGDLSLAYTAFEGSISGGAIEGTVKY